MVRTECPSKKEDIFPCRIVFEMVTDPQKNLNQTWECFVGKQMGLTCLWV